MPEYDTSAVAAFWESHDIDRYLEHINERSTPQRFRDAFRVRDSLAALFLSPSSPSFERPHGDAEAIAHRVYVDNVCSRILDQGRLQNRDLLPQWRKKGRKETFMNTIIGLPNPSRPFCELFGSASVDHILQAFLKTEALQMPHACRFDPEKALPIVWLGYLKWTTFNPYAKAQVILAAEQYRKDEAAAEAEFVRMLTAASPLHNSHTSNALGHRHLPSLTSRQARRYTTSAEGLRARWGA